MNQTCFEIPKSSCSVKSNYLFIVFVEIVITLYKVSRFQPFACTTITQMDRQIVAPDHGLNNNGAISTGEKNSIHRSRPNGILETPNSNARLCSSFVQKSCPVLIKYESPITEKCFDIPRISVKSLLSVLSRFMK